MDNLRDRAEKLKEFLAQKRTFLLWMTDFFRSQLARTLDILGIAVPEYM